MNQFIREPTLKNRIIHFFDDDETLSRVRDKNENVGKEGWLDKQHVVGYTLKLTDTPQPSDAFKMKLKDFTRFSRSRVVGEVWGILGLAGDLEAWIKFPEEYNKSMYQDVKFNYDYVRDVINKIDELIDQLDLDEECNDDPIEVYGLNQYGCLLLKAKLTIPENTSSPSMVVVWILIAPRYGDKKK